MKAIIQVSKTSAGDKVSLLGIGATEQAARWAAFQYLNHGSNNNNEHYQGGILIDVSARLAALHAAPQWNENFNADGAYVGNSCTDAHHDLLAALTRLEINADGLLDYHERETKPGAWGPDLDREIEDLFGPLEGM